MKIPKRQSKKMPAEEGRPAIGLSIMRRRLTRGRTPEMCPAFLKCRVLGDSG